MHASSAAEFNVFTWQSRYTIYVVSFTIITAVSGQWRISGSGWSSSSSLLCAVYHVRFVG